MYILLLNDFTFSSNFFSFMTSTLISENFYFNIDNIYKKDIDESYIRFRLYIIWKIYY